MNPDKTRYQDYCRQKAAVIYTPAKVINGEVFRIVKGGLVPEKVFQKENPVELRPLMKSIENPDRKTAATK